jgi:hypothetical protein
MSPFDPYPRRTDLRDAPPALAWVIRIGFTVFAIPFLIIGLLMLFGGGVIGSQFSSFGWLGSLFGLPFIAVPIIMIAAVWLSPMRPKSTDAAAAAASPSPSSGTPTACAYCGRPRPSATTACESCGAF